MRNFLRSLLIVFALQAFIVIPASGTTCDYDPLVADLLAQADQDRWVNWIAELSGAKPIQTPTGEAIIKTRSSFVLFEPGQNLSAFTYLQNELVSLGYQADQDFEVHTYAFPYGDRYLERNWKNLILTIPGVDPELKQERLLMVAHLDSTSDQEQTLAPGADDNATGAAGLLEAAAVLQHYQFARTIHLIWFSGEEQSRRGSEYFVADHTDWLPDIQGVINLDMFGFDWDEDRCFEIHTGELPGSQAIGTCLANVIESYGLDLTFDLIDDERAYTYSDHNAFWLEGIPGVMLIENFSYQADGVCGNADRNYQYHQITDTLTYINADTGFAILQAAMAALAHQAGPQSECFPDAPWVLPYSDGQHRYLQWENLRVKTYQVWHQQGGRWEILGTTRGTTWALPLAAEELEDYKIVALSETGCRSSPGFVGGR